jgi:hypothetical protein
VTTLSIFRFLCLIGLASGIINSRERAGFRGGVAGVVDQIDALRGPAAGIRLANGVGYPLFI